MLALTRRTSRVSPDASHQPRRRASRPMLEALEERIALSLGSEFRIGSSSNGGVYGAASASSANGTSVVAYVEPSSEIINGKPNGVMVVAQRYSASGVPVGSPIGAGGGDSQLAAAMDASGDSVIVSVAHPSSGSTSILATRISSTGQVVYPQLTVAYYKGNSSEPSVAMDKSGNFVVSWTYQYGAYNQNQVWATRYTWGGTNLGNVAVATWTTANDRESHIAMTPDGRFDIVYQLTNNSNNISYIFENSYSATGQLTGEAIVDAGQAGSTEYYPVVAIDNADDAVISWYELKNNNRNIMMRQLSHTGILGALTPLTNNSAQDLDPQVAMNATTGSFVISFRLGFNIGSTEVFEMNANGSFRAAYNTGSNRIGSSISIDGKGYYQLTYTNYTNPTTVWGRFGFLG